MQSIIKCPAHVVLAIKQDRARKLGRAPCYYLLKLYRFTPGGDISAPRLRNTKEIRRVQHPPVTSLRARAYFWRGPFDILGALCIRCCMCLPPSLPVLRVHYGPYTPRPSAEVSFRGAGEAVNWPGASFMKTTSLLFGSAGGRKKKIREKEREYGNFFSEGERKKKKWFAWDDAVASLWNQQLLCWRQ